ncbi:MYCBP-associated protein [Calypte anna]|uniref:MYCBP-associated protein n=1 Tax=Calypte anna TaxID=9244 RepID=UPI0011C3843E|nr:MYCBP-associated protein [Calypte anna]
MKQGPARRDLRPGSPPEMKEEMYKLSFSPAPEEPEPYVLQDDIQVLASKEAALKKTADFIEVSSQDVTTASLKEKCKRKKKKVHQSLLTQHKALQSWDHHMAIRKKQEKHLGEILQRPEDELLMSVSEHYRQIQEERDLIDWNLPALLPGKGYRRGSEFWSQPERIGDELTGLTLTLTQRERGCPEPVTHVGKPHAVQMETGLKPPKKIPFYETWDKSLFLKQRRQDLEPILEELNFYKPDLDGLEVIGTRQPFTSVSRESSPPSTSSNESETLSGSLQDDLDAVPEAVQGPSLVFGGHPACWISYTTPCRDKVGITAEVTFETKTGELAESSLTVSNDGTTAIWYEWMRLPQGIPFRKNKEMRMPCFYFDTRSGVILPEQTRKFSILFKSETAGVFSEYWEFRTHPLLLGGALLQMLLCGLAEYVDKWADVREKLKCDLAARVAASIAKESLEKCLAQIRTPERAPSPVGACVTEEDLFHLKNPKLHYQHQVVKQLHELWRKHMTVPSATEEEVPSGQQRMEKDTECQEGTSESQPPQDSTTEDPSWKNTLEEDPSHTADVKKEEPGWNYSFEDFKQAILSIPNEEEQEAALAQLNHAALELCIEQRPTQTNLLYQTCLMLWCETIDNMVSCSMRLRSSLELPENTTYLDTFPEETVEVNDPVLYQQYQEKFYVQVYGLLDSMVSKMFSFFEDLKEEGALKWEAEARFDQK